MRRRPLLALAGLILVPMSPPAAAIEEPAFELLREIGAVELRRYAPYVVAEVVLDAEAQRAGNEAFPILAGYIFGKNRGQQKFAMTAPVTQMPVTPATDGEPVRLAMTAPVTQSATPGVAGAPDRQRVQFVLPRGVALADAPVPLDPRVQLREEPAVTRAVIRYSGTWSQANYDEHLGELRSALSAAGLSTQGEPVLARYNGPWTPWFMRRNEIWLTLR